MTQTSTWTFSLSGPHSGSRAVADQTDSCLGMPLHLQQTGLLENAPDQRHPRVAPDVLRADEAAAVVAEGAAGAREALVDELRADVGPVALRPRIPERDARRDIHDLAAVVGARELVGAECGDFFQALAVEAGTAGNDRPPAVGLALVVVGQV